ncbi:NADP-dependent oxidoreductase domain-containing protein [Aspergillus unguis]
MSVSDQTTVSLLARYRQLAPSASVKVSPICLGAMTFGGTNQARYGECSKEDAIGILNYFYDNGGNFIDTANAYHQGQSEYTSAYKLHEKNKIQANYVGTGTKNMRVSLEQSLRNLQTSYLMHGLNDLVVSGKVIYLGISDTPAWVVSLANQYARDHGLRQFTRDIIPMCLYEGMGLCPYGTLNQGRFQTVEGYKAREKSNPGRKFIPLSEKDKQVAGVLERVADKRDDGISLLNVALAYIYQKAPYVFPILGARTVDHLRGNIPALAVTLSEEEIDEIDSAYEFDHGFPHTFLSGTLFDNSRSKPAYGSADVFHLKHGGAQFDWVERPKPIVAKK